MFSSIRWRITIPYIVVILITTLGLVLYISFEVRQTQLDELESRVVAEARLMAANARETLANAGTSRSGIERLAGIWADVLGGHVTILAADGSVLADSHASSSEIGTQFYQPEVQRALAGGYGTSIRYSNTLSHDVIYAAANIETDGVLQGWVRLALPLDEVQRNVQRLRETILVAGGVTAGFSILLAMVIASKTTRPVKRLTESVERMATGDLSMRLLPTTRDEIGQLTRALNHMADQLRDKVSTLALERSRLSVVLETMADGVIITDEDGRIELFNAAASRILQYDEARAIGRRFSQAVYSHRLIELWSRCYETGVEQNETVETSLYGNFLHVTIAPLAGSQERYLTMLQDLTRVRRLETVRRDFISNISHELRTPLASLALVVETLQDGAIEDPPAARRFLTHMQTELASLTQMVEELLELSRIESRRVPLVARSVPVVALIEQPIERLLPQAERKGVDLNISLRADLPRVRADATRIHQVVTNLVHNAIKFTPSGGAVTVFARRYEPEDGSVDDDASEAVVVGVTDTGIGIPEEDAERIFERFYKTDRARSEEGTGLGLAIAKHIVHGHGGKIWVESTVGIGSTFFFTLQVAHG
jgi:two-component system, OmpR family, phosphate regulon sensor histidine kinase PhoR